MQIEKDYERLVWAWKGWHDGCGNKIRSVYLSYIDLLNKNAKVTVLPAAGHIPFLTHQKIFNELITGILNEST